MACACGGNTGAYINVKVTDASITTVALYIGSTDCSVPNSNGSVACNGLTPEGEVSRLGVGQNGHAYFRDTDSAFTSKVVNGVAQFHLEANGKAQTVALVAIGYADFTARDARAVKVMEGVEIPAVDPVDLQTTLDAASQVAANEDPKTAQPDGEYVLVWTSPSAPSDCVLVESWSSGKATRVYVVPSEDSDCDGLPTQINGSRNPMECDPLWFMRPTPVSSGNMTCAALGTYGTVMPGTNPDVCMIGGPACIDGRGTTADSCAPLANAAYCLPQAVCPLHCALPNGGPLGPCLDGLVQTTGSFFHYECTLYATDPGAACTGAGGAIPTTGTLDFATLFAGSSKTCGDVLWAPDSIAPLQSVDTLSLAGASAMFSQNTSNNPCSIDVTWNGGTLDTFQRTWMLADVVIQDTQHLIVPVLFTRVGCPTATPPTNDFICMPVPGTTVADTITQCAQ